MRRYIVSVVIVLLGMLPVSNVMGQQGEKGKDPALTELEIKVAHLEWKLEQVERNTSDISKKTKDYAPIGLVLFLFGGFCALWAQNTGHNAWAWFLWGVLFSFITVLAILTGRRNENLNKRR